MTPVLHNLNIMLTIPVMPVFHLIYDANDALFFFFFEKLTPLSIMVARLRVPFEHLDRIMIITLMFEG